MRPILYLSLVILISCKAYPEQLEERDFLNLYHESLATLSVKEEECTNKANILADNTFKKLNLTQEQINIVLRYKNTNAFVSCSNGARLQYYKASLLLRAYSDKFTKTVDVSDELISYHDIRLIELDKKYKDINQNIRFEIDKIETLNKPFNLLESFDATQK
jgi:hypothetical protein